jgi:hypothetical protein
VVEGALAIEELEMERSCCLAVDLQPAGFAGSRGSHNGQDVVGSRIWHSGIEGGVMMKKVETESVTTPKEDTRSRERKKSRRRSLV